MDDAKYTPFVQEQQKLANNMWNRHVPSTGLESIVAATNFDDFEHQKLQKEPDINTVPLVKILRGSKGTPDPRNADRLNKDLIVQFVFSVPVEPIKQRVPKIFIEENVFVRGNRKKDQPPESSCDIKLFGKVENNNGYAVPLCNSCKKRGETQNLKIRSADIDVSRASPAFFEIVVKGSVTCSGNPPNCNNVLRVKFWLTLVPKTEDYIREETILWSGETPTFGVLHHRRKEEAVTTVETKIEPTTPINYKSQPKEPIPHSIVPSMKMPPCCEHGCKCHSPSTPEVLGLSMEFVLNDSTQELFDLHVLHVGILHSEMFMKEHSHLFPMKLHPHVVSLTLGLNAVRDAMFDFEFQDNGRPGHLIRKLEFYFAHCSKALLALESEKDAPPSKQIALLIWKHACQMRDPASRVCNFYCCCKSCILSHLAFIIQAALHRGASLEDVARCFNESAPPSILKDLLDFKGRHFNMSIYVSDTPIGRFSRAFYPPSMVKQSWWGINSATEEIVKSQPHLLAYMQLLYPIEVYPMIYQFIQAVGAAIGGVPL